MQYVTETITVQQLFEEELEALRERYDSLIGQGTDENLKEAENLEHVIRYFEARLGHTTTLHAEGPYPDDTVH